ncbi:hypothetical protein OHB26_32650 [Nocardia sp. NBC_01503]|uniref:hypothetical protein n=1 Tax=Nocardia sp. NBC_01503 TaxID=2975997 RepID=UPI002E7C19BE|nr:hypothetical protein [Nocardia sp. NBC_01503]WTL31610.1 hypothetical protein OHB26_32650 [Nocardia sp. NBC_01503]
MNFKMKIAAGVIAGTAAAVLGAGAAQADPNPPVDPCVVQPSLCRIGGAVQNGSTNQRQMDEQAGQWNR